MRIAQAMRLVCVPAGRGAPPDHRLTPEAGARGNRAVVSPQEDLHLGTYVGRGAQNQILRVTYIFSSALYEP